MLRATQKDKPASWHYVKGWVRSALDKTMASDNKKPKADPAPKNEAAAKNESTPGEDVSKAEGGETAAAAPSNYSRGEGQKPVTASYKENWDAIFAKKKREEEKAIIRTT